MTGHFSAEYEDLMTELIALQKKIKTAQDEEIALDSKADFYPELAGQFADEKHRLGKLIKARKSALDVLSLDLTEKQTNAFTSLAGAAVDDPSEQIASTIETINKIISEHNNRTAQFDKKRQEAFEKLEKHYAASFVRDEKYNDQLKQIAELKTTVAEQGKKLVCFDAEIQTLEKELSEASKGAERINDTISHN